MIILTSMKEIVIDVAIGAPGHGKYVVYVLITRYHRLYDMT